MDEILDCVDRFGRRVVLHEARWREHILIDHAEMESLLPLIRQALVDPDLVNIDVDFENRESFYLLSITGTRGNRHIKVCVEYGYGDYQDDHDGRIVTSYVTRTVKTREVTKWHRTN